MSGSREVTALKAGLMALMAMVVVIWLAFGGANPFDQRFELKMRVQSGSELHSRTPVRIAGVEVGKVKKVERGDGNEAIVTLRLDKHALPIHRDATAKVRPRIFLEGNFFVDLTQGTPSEPELESGDELPAHATAIPVQLDQVLTTLTRSTREELRAVVRNLGEALDGGGAEALNESLPYWQPAFARGAQAMEALRGRERHDLSRSVAASETLARALADRDDELAEGVTGLARTSTAFASRREQLAQSIPEFNQLLREAEPALGALNALFPTARAFVAEARPGIRELPATLRLANPLLAQLQGALSPPEIPALVRFGDPAIRALARLQPHLRELLRLLYPVTECVRHNVLPTLTAVIEDPPLTDGKPPLPVYRELLNGIVGQGSGSQNFDGNGPDLRYLSGWGDTIVRTGNVASAGGEPLVGVTNAPILGSRPRFTNQLPPVRTDQSCVSQDPPDLRADTGPPPAQQKLSALRSKR
jgi:phospholipid/cholesterol/gamma-HCH transport system substrate-binding protein